MPQKDILDSTDRDGVPFCAYNVQRQLSSRFCGRLDSAAPAASQVVMLIIVVVMTVQNIITEYGKAGGTVWTSVASV